MLHCRHRVVEVHVDGLALIKIVKHCRDALPKMVAGSLLGLDQGSILEVTHCFPFLAPGSLDDRDAGDVEDDVDGEEYQMEMMKMLREVNVDNNCVGWYKSIYAGSFCQSPLVETQLSYQDNLCSNCVVLLYDPSETNLSVKAYQISEEFVASYRSKSNSFVSPSSILVQLPLKVRNPGLINALLYGIHTSCQLKVLSSLGIEAASPIELNLEHCCQWVDDLLEEQNKFQNYLRSIERYKDHLRWHAKRKSETEDEDLQNPLWKSISQPPRLDSLLIANQIQNYCTGINSHAAYVLSALQIEAAAALLF